MEPPMKHLPVTIAIFVLSTSLALAHSTFGAPGTANGMNPPSIPSPSDEATVGFAPGVNPSNSQDLTYRANPQDLTMPRSSNPEDLTNPK
jgi:hypothetical protein